MINTMLKGKIHRATVVQAELDYVGSITIDEELMEAAGRWNAEGYRMIAVLRRESELKNATLQKALGQVNGVEVYFDCEKHAELAAREMFVDPEKLPLLVVLKGGLRGIFACAGYNVGSVDLAMKLMQK